ncbi:ankyrin repeat-containing protein [Neptunitalea chrysea]|uniref:Ankyrin repeat-containing protein n=1 Tax=Neptunitalea chrysea TaxID=1647581 RepID=A0A9W6B6I5_9FLAO|nr:ankyrin repeat domain-containing protein [Neptunitalea chrysea]GLB52212.1 ankyrin repeat-containing protein [Neptunitalea chrysea]
MKLFYLVSLIFFSFQYTVSAQDAMPSENGVNVFDLARNGTLQQMDSLYTKTPYKIDSIDMRGFTPLILSCYRGSDEVAVFVAEHTKNINYSSDNGTALMALVFKQNLELSKKLLDYGADPNMADKNGVTPLIYAIQFKNLPMVELLLEKGADKSQKDATGKSPFEYAVFSKNQEIINLLKN